MTGVLKRWIVTAYNEAGGAFRYMAETISDAENTAKMYEEMNLSRVSVRSVLWDTRKNAIV